ncbi:hypothetical protein SUGI_0019120 [Cryptomeria japonica]|uniref:uncharacterized protein LOC131864486 n=1 Tax=Cryptomeria japonica TaxID=3369 RepID=UPI002408C79D|nr:uncharacterized protein LOC131864486 [Cryptomeria japonica]GLJ05500.1 hypothetical protein SUGI_0019120 [Cryptomeria japonica]
MAIAMTSRMVLAQATTQRQKHREECEYKVYVGSMRLRATPGPAQWAFSTAYSVACWDVQHFIVLFKPQHAYGPCLLFDFQPKDPTNPHIALAALFGHGVPGIVQKRELPKLPTKRYWLIGEAEKDVSIQRATEFNQHWATELKLGEHDCRHYTNALIEHIMGEHNVLGRLRNTIPD